MKIDNISSADDIVLLSASESDVVIIADITINDKFECYRAFFWKESKCYWFSLVDDDIEDQIIPEKDLIKIKNAVDSIGGVNTIITAIQDKYNEYIKIDSLYSDLGKDNIKLYTI